MGDETMGKFSILSAVIALLLMLGCVGGLAAEGTTNSPAGLDELRKQFETTIREVQRQAQDAAKLHRQRYLTGLTALEDALQSAGNQLSAVLAVNAEKARFEQSGDIPSDALATNLPAVRKLQDAWCAQTAGGPREQAQKIVAASDRYLQNLARLQKDLAARNDTRGMEVVKAERDRLLNNNLVREALALVQSSTVPNTLPIPLNGLRLWLKADGSLVKDRDGRVSVWRDQSGQGFDVQQKDKSKHPLLVLDAKGKPRAVQFDGADDVLETAKAIDLLATKNVKVLCPPFTFIIVVNPGQRQCEHADILDYEHGTALNLVVQQDGNRLNTFYTCGGGEQTLVPGVFQIYSICCDQQTITSLLNAAHRRESPMSALQVLQPRRFTVGCKSREALPRHFNGQLAEILIYNRALKDKERQAVETNLARKYAIAINP